MHPNLPSPIFPTLPPASPFVPYLEPPPFLKCAPGLLLINLPEFCFIGRDQFSLLVLNVSRFVGDWTT